MPTNKTNQQTQQNHKEYPLFHSKTHKDLRERKRRYELAWKEAKKAADFLKKEYNAEKVYVFGSMTNPMRFNQRSDIDLAVSGIPDDKFFQAIGALNRLIPTFDIDLVDIKDCKAFIKREIFENGVEI